MERAPEQVRFRSAEAGRPVELARQVIGLGVSARIAQVPIDRGRCRYVTETPWFRQNYLGEWVIEQDKLVYMVERRLAKAKVAGSNPVFRSNLSRT